MQVNPGELDKKILIFKKGGDQDKDGFYTEEKTTVRRCWAAFRRLSIKEKQEAGIDLEEEKVRFLCRYSKKQVTTAMFVEYGGCVYNITGINDYGDGHEYMEILAEKG